MPPAIFILLHLLSFSLSKSTLVQPISKPYGVFSFERHLTMQEDTIKKTPLYLIKDTVHKENKISTTPQSPPSLKNFSPEAGDPDFSDIISNTSWTIESFPNWVAISPLNGSGNGRITITPKANKGGQRSGFITISGLGVTTKIALPVIQLSGKTESGDPTKKQQQTVYYIAVNGNDINPGTIDKPFASLNGAWKTIKAGDMIYIRGGTYEFNRQQVLTKKSGTAGNMIKVWAYPGETPVLSKGKTYSGSFGIELQGNYIYLKGLKISGYTQSPSGGLTPPLLVQNANNNIFELIEFSKNGGAVALSVFSTDNLFLNCDFHHQYDPFTIGDPYGNSDGMDCATSPGTTNTVRGCRFWNNSDDGLDLYRSDGNFVIDHCWAWNNGFREDETTKGGDGIGFKLGITKTDLSNQVLRTVTNCLSFKNRLGGIFQNGANCILHIYNNTTYSNKGGKYTGGIGFGDKTTIVHVVKNNIAFDEMLAAAGNEVSVQDHNSWNSGLSVSRNDFISLDYTGIDGPRQADGSLPNISFLKLKKTSRLYQKGTMVGLPFYGTAPNIGAF